MHSTHRPSTRATLMSVAIGGVVGATGRWAVAVALDTERTAVFPWPTFVVNVVGCLLIGVAAGRLRRGSLPWSFVVTGALGGFTTMSSFAVELDRLVDAGRTPLAATYLVATIGAGFGALHVAELLSRPPGSLPPEPDGIE